MPPIETPLVKFSGAATIRNGKKILEDTNWAIYPGQHWAIVGPNGAGKSSLCRMILGELPICSGSIARAPFLWEPGRIAYVAFVSQKRLIRREERRDASRIYKGAVDEETPVREILLDAVEGPMDPQRFDEISGALHLTPLLEHGIRSLSNGEMRKLLIARGLLRNPKLLLLDEPFDGLDASSCEEFKKLINDLTKQGVTIVLITHRFEEIPSRITHVLGVNNCRVLLGGKKAEILDQKLITQLYQSKPFSLKGLEWSAPSKESSISQGPLLDLKDVSVVYGQKVVFEQLNWTVNPGENWKVTGRNGAGKSTLLQLISGNHLQAYTNEIYLFGRKRGSGESVWEIKKKIGLVTTELQVKFNVNISVLHVVLSGFYDTIGLFAHPTSSQMEIAQKWLNLLSFKDKAACRFDQLSQGEQRMTLLARAMVKSPQLLIADEPCQGLDYANRKLILEWIDAIGNQTPTQVIYVTHHVEDHLQCITHQLHL